MREGFRAGSVLLWVSLATSGAAAEPLGPEFQVNTYTTGAQYRSAVAPAENGGFVVAWESLGSSGTDTSGYSIQAQPFSGAGTPLGPELQVNSFTTGDQRFPSVTPDGSGGFVVAWSSDGSSGTDSSGASIQARRLSGTGVLLGPEFQVNTYTTNTQYRPNIASDGSGGFVVTWESFGSSGTDASGYSIQAQRFSSGGMPLGPEFQVNTYTTNTQYRARVSPDGSGGFVVVWNSVGSSGTDTSNSSIQAQRFSSSGAPAGPEFQVNTYTTDIQYRVSVAPDGSGGFVVAWGSLGSSGTDASFRSIQARQFSATGVPAGPEFQVNTYTTNNQFRPSLAPDGGGGFVVVWRSYGSRGTDTSNSSIQARQFSSAGVALGPEVQVNTYTTGNQFRPSVSSDGRTGFVVVWDTVGSAGTDSGTLSIQARRFDSTSTSTSTTSTSTSTSTTRPGLVPGGPRGKTRGDCYLELALANGASAGVVVEQNRIVRCEDGTACDQDGLCNGTCVVAVGVCLNQTDPALADCVPPTRLLRVTVRGRPPVPLDVPSERVGPACGALTAVAVETRFTRAGRYRGRKSRVRLRGAAVAVRGTRPRRDKDKWTIQCLPTTAPTTCPTVPGP